MLMPPRCSQTCQSFWLKSVTPSVSQRLFSSFLSLFPSILLSPSSFHSHQPGNFSAPFLRSSCLLLPFVAFLLHIHYLNINNGACCYCCRPDAAAVSSLIFCFLSYKSHHPHAAFAICGRSKRDSLLTTTSVSPPCSVAFKLSWNLDGNWVYN